MQEELEKTLNDIVKEKGTLVKLLSDHTSRGILYTVVYTINF